MPVSEASLPRELALRVALAARALPDTSTSKLLDILDEAIGLPLTVTKLDGLTVKAFRRAGGENMMAVPGDSIKSAIGYLKGTEDDNERPEIEAYAEGEMPGSLRVACAANPTAKIRCCRCTSADGDAVWRLRATGYSGCIASTNHVTAVYANRPRHPGGVGAKRCPGPAGRATRQRQDRSDRASTYARSYRAHVARFWLSREGAGCYRSG